MRNGIFRYHEGAARVDLVHQIDAAHVGLHDRRPLDGARVVDHDIESAESCDGLLDRAFHLRLVAHVDDDSQRVSAASCDLVGSTKAGAGHANSCSWGAARGSAAATSLRWLPRSQWVARSNASVASLSRTPVHPKSGSLLALTAWAVRLSSPIYASTVAPPASGSLRVTRSIAWMPLVPS